MYTLRLEGGVGCSQLLCGVFSWSVTPEARQRLIGSSGISRGRASKMIPIAIFFFFVDAVRFKNVESVETPGGFFPTYICVKRSSFYAFHVLPVPLGYSLKYGGNDPRALFPPRTLPAPGAARLYGLPPH